MRLHAVHNMSGSYDLCLRAKAQHPRKELRTDHHVRPDGEMGRAVGDDEHLAAQPVQNGAYQVIFKRICTLISSPVNIPNVLRV